MAKQIHCKFCNTFIKDIDHYAAHLENAHIDMIPTEMCSRQFIYYLTTGRTHGNCIICKSPTKWNDKTNKYHRFCNNPKCKEKYIDIFKHRMIGKYGKVNLLNDPEQQKKMLANRKISGIYEWSDKIHKHTYTGTYEKSFLEFLDNILNFDPEDVIAPSPHNYYYIYDGKQHFYIPDFFIPSLNLEIEIKEGTNMHPKNLAVDKVKESLKDEVMKTNSSSFNYLKIVEKDNMKFIKYLEIVKEKYLNNDNSSIIMI